MIFLSLLDLSISTCARGDKDDGAHLRYKKQAIFAEILQIGFTAGLLPWSIGIFEGQLVSIITVSTSSDYCAKSICY